MKHIGTKTIETERLILRRFKLSDFNAMFKNYCNDEEVTRYLSWKPHKNLEETTAYLKDFILPEYSKKTTYRWAIVLKENPKEVVGCIDVVRANDNSARAEIGYVIGRAFWGKGYVPEAARKVLEVLFDVGYNRIEALYFSENAKSGRVMEKIGMKHEGTLRDYTKNNKGEFVDCEIYSILKGEKR